MLSGATRELSGKIRFKTISDLDMRTNAAKRVKALIEALEADFETGSLTEADRQLMQRAAFLAAYSEHQETAYLRGEKIDEAKYLRAVNLYFSSLDNLKSATRAAPQASDPRAAIMELFEEYGFEFPRAANSPVSDAAPEGGEADQPVPPASPPPTAGEMFLVGDGGAFILLDEIDDTGELKWACYDALNRFHGYRRRRADAEAFTATLPGGAGG